MAASAVSAKGVAGNADAALAAAQDNSRRVTPDATVEHVRKKMHPDNVFTTPVVPQISPELSTMAYIAQLRLHRQRQYEAARGAEEATHRAKSVAVARPVSVAAASPTAGSPASPASPKAADTDNGGGDDDDDDGQVALDNDDTDEIYGSSPLHIAARKNRVRDIRLWVQSYSKNTLDNRDFTPLMVAASHNSVKALVLLLRMGVRKDDVDCKTQRTALHWAVLHGHSASVLSLLQYGADARFRDRDGRTPVHLAALHPKPDCLKIILRFVNPEALLEGDNEQMAPFHLAVMCDNVRHLQLMMSLRPPIFMTTGDVEGKTALHWCAQNLDAKTYAPTFFHTPKTCATLLIENQPLLVGIKDLEGRTALHLACSVGNIPLIVEVCSQLQIPSAHVKAIVNTQDLHGRTALHYAAIAGQAYILRVLRHYGADDGLADKDGATPLHYACSKNHGQCVSILISDNRLRYTYTRDNQGRTPIMWAVIKGYSEALRILLEAGVNPSEIDDKRTTALHICGAGGHAHCASLLLEHGATVDVRNADQRSALFLAVQHGHGETANVLIQHGANVSMLDSEQRSPLHWAALCGHLSVVSLLISCNGQVDHQDSEGKTPLHCAAYNGHTEVVSFLLKNGAKIDCKDREGVSVLHWATCGNHTECVKVLLQQRANANMLDNDFLTPLDYAIAVRSYDCVDILKVHGGQSGDIVSDVYANRIQKAWKRHARRKIRIKMQAIASANHDAGKTSITHSTSGGFYGRSSGSGGHGGGGGGGGGNLELPTGFSSGRRVSIAAMGGALPRGATDKRRASLVLTRRASRDLTAGGLGLRPGGGGDSSGPADSLGVQQSDIRNNRSRTLFPSRPSLIKTSLSRSRVQINANARYDQPLTETLEEDELANGGAARTNMDGSMSSFEMEYFKMEAERRREEEEE